MQCETVREIQPRQQQVHAAGEAEVVGTGDDLRLGHLRGQGRRVHEQWQHLAGVSVSRGLHTGEMGLAADLELADLIVGVSELVKAGVKIAFAVPSETNARQLRLTISIDHATQNSRARDDRYHTDVRIENPDSVFPYAKSVGEK